MSKLETYHFLRDYQRHQILLEREYNVIMLEKHEGLFFFGFEILKIYQFHKMFCHFENEIISQ